MLIALLLFLGVSLAVVVALLLTILARRRWVGRQPGAFKGAVRVAEGHFDGLGSKWRKGYGRSGDGVLVWTKGPFLFQKVSVPTERMAEIRAAKAGEVKRLGNAPIVAELTTEGASVWLAAHGEDRGLVAAARP
jgi:hypothetical protein